ncbi:tetratricopeptide repeat protein [Candidatus Electronema sp. TJ]|uniref:tetratricopeptide repeat protein n=1 Tax=Candidatus Electronema sp. TJ TaxID=3401573 RepID=UPI003AA7CC3C
MRQESACAKDEEERAMNEVSVWIEHLRHPLVLAGFGLLLLFALIRAFRRGTPRSDAGKLIHLLALLVMSGIVYWNKDNPGIALPVFITLLDVAANGALAWKESKQEIDPGGKPAVNITAAGQGQITISGDVITADGDIVVRKQYIGLSEEQYAAEKQKDRDLLLKEIRAAFGDEEKLQLLEVQLKAVEGQLANIQKSYEEEIARRKAANKALDDFKGQLPDARIAEAKKSLEQGDAAAAEQLFDEVADKEGKAVALANYQGGQLAEGRIDYAKAMRQYKKAAALEEDNPDYLLAAGKMALTLADYSHAQEWFERLLKIREKEGKEDKELALVLDRLATLHQYQGDYKTAEPLFKRSLAIDEKNLGKNHPDVAASLNNLAGLYYSQGRYEDAEPLYKRSLEIKEKSLGKDHPDVATTLNNLAGLYESQGRYEDAEPLYKRDLAISEKSLGKDHPSVATTLNNLAGLYRAQVRYEDAEPLYKRALEIVEKVLGKDHPDVAATLNNLAELYRAQGRYEDAEPLYKRALEIVEKVLGKDHPHVAAALNNLALLYHAQGKYAEAEPLYQRSLSILKAKLPAGHPYIKMGQENYDDLKRKMAGR